MLEFQAIDWFDYNSTESKEKMVSDSFKNDDHDDHDDHDDGDDDGEKYINKYKAQIFGRTAKGESVAVTITDFTPFFFVQVPDNWTGTHLKLLVNGLKEKMSKAKELAETLQTDMCKIVQRRIFHGFTNKKMFKFVRLVWTNSSAIKYASKIFSRDAQRFEGLSSYKYQVYEIIDPVLQLMQIRGIKPCGWIQIGENKYSKNKNLSTTADISVTCKYTDLVPIYESSISGIVRMSYDIECICQCKDEGFPNFAQAKDEIIQIGMVFRRYPETKSYLRAILTQKKCAPMGDKSVVVIECENERDLLFKFRDLVNKENPDIMYGYNTSGFDDNYIYKRTELLKIDKEFMKMSRNRFIDSIFQEKKLSSSGLGQNIYKMIVSTGRVTIDVMKVVQRDHKLSSYKLDEVAEHFLDENKNDLDHIKLFQNYIEGRPEQIREICEYCIQDCELVHNLVDFLNIIPANMSMSSVSIVPLNYIFMRGQGIKIYSLVADQCRKHGILIADLGNEADGEHFEGAYVIEPESKIHHEPIVVCDFNSLYPSIMIANNFSQDSIVIDKKYDDLPGIKYNTYYYRDPDTDEKKSAKFVDHIENPELMGILPIVLRYLLNERAATRVQIADLYKAIKLIKEASSIEEPELVEKVEKLLRANDRLQNTIQIPLIIDMLKKKKGGDVIVMMKSKIMILDTFQLAFKVVANSIYGQCGSTFSKIKCKPISACVTSEGKNNLTLAQKHVIEKYGAECVYGDSVTADTLIIVRHGDNISRIAVIEFDEMCSVWEEYHNTKIAMVPEDYYIWSDLGWTRIIRFIKHTTKKPIYRVETDVGSVTVTADHSLLLKNGKSIKPTDIIVGKTELMFNDIPQKYTDEWKNGTGRVIKITLLRENTNELVYDFETENHHFAAGVGKLIVHNTDSIFVKFKVDHVVDPTLSEEENNYRKRVESQKLGIRAADEITKLIGRDPMCIAYEKICHPLLILKKKRYMYQKFEKELEQSKAKFIAMGVLLKRRDNCPIVQEIYRDVVDLLMSHGTMKDVVKYLLKKFMKFKQYNKYRKQLNKDKYLEHLKLFTTSKTLKSRDSYKNPERIEHRVLADRMTLRDPGNPPKPNDRIQFVYVKVPDKFNEKGKKIKILQGEKIETPEYIIANNLEIDYKFYLTNKLKVPLEEILMMEYDSEKSKDIYNRLIEKYDST
jgi:DNA polymerase elongation subunit (family B)